MADAINLGSKIKSAPKTPGCYLFKNELGHIIYVGKAKVLRNRVRQYFQGSEKDDKVQKLVSMIVDVEFIETESELDALIQEYRLIKEYKPWFNAQMKANKIHPLLKIDMDAAYPSLSIAYEREDNNAKYIDGFRDVPQLKKDLDLLNQLWKTPTCEKPSFESPNKPCLNYHLDRCMGPCGRKVEPKEYQSRVSEMTEFLGGKMSLTVERLRKEYNSYVTALEFEAAAQCNDLLTGLEYLQKKSEKVFHFPENEDVVLLISAFRSSQCSLFYVRKGAVVARQDFIGEVSNKDVGLFLKRREIKQQDYEPWLPRCLAEISAYKRFIPAGGETVKMDIRKAVSAWMKEK